MNGPDGFRFEWVVTEALAASSVEQLLASGIDISEAAPQPVEADRLPDAEDAGFEPLLVITGTAAIVYLANAVSRIVRNHRQGGVVIDARKASLEIREGVRGVDSGTVVVLSNEGSQVFKAPDEAGLLRALAPR
jgi:hypothetical protein